MVKLPPNVSFEQAARFGYLGTSYSALSKSGIRPGQLSSSMELAALWASAPWRLLWLSVSREFWERREIISCLNGSKRLRLLGLCFLYNVGLGRGMEQGLTAGEGVDVAIDALGAGAPPASTLDALRSVRKGGRMVIIGGVSGDVPVNVKWLMDNSIQLIGSLWFSTAEGQETAIWPLLALSICRFSSPRRFLYRRSMT